MDIKDVQCIFSRRLSLEHKNTNRLEIQTGQWVCQQRLVIISVRTRTVSLCCILSGGLYFDNLVQRQLIVVLAVGTLVPGQFSLEIVLF